jgi:Zn ribbon nucleic-acid-binding protein
VSTTDDETRWLCHLGPECADARTETNTNPDGTRLRVRIPAIATAPGLLCRTDTTIVRTAIQQLPMDYFELSTLLRKTSTGEAPTSGTRELPAPLRLGVAALADTILDELERWAAVIAESVGMWYVPAGARPVRLQHSADWLVGLYERLLRLPATWHARLDPTEHTTSGKDAVRYTEETGLAGALNLLQLHEQTRLLAGRTQRAERMNAPCPKCHRLALERQQGQAHVDCLRCGYRTTLDDYEESASVLAASYERWGKRRDKDMSTERPTRVCEGPPIFWEDGTVHERRDAGSNMALSYLARYDARTAAA